MSPTRRHAALGLMAAAAVLPATRAVAQDNSAPPQLELPDEDHPPTELAARQDKNEHLLAPVTINEQGPFNFLLDTGANVSCVSHRLMERLALKPGETALVHTVVGARERPVVTLDRLQVGPRDRRRVRAPALPLKGPEVDGILGVDWLKGQRLVLDFKHSRLEITRSQSDSPEPGRVVVVPARRRKGQLTIVDADLSGSKISAIIDSGAQGTLCNLKLRDLARSQEMRRGEPQAPQYVQMESLAGERFTGEAVFLPFLRLGGLHLGNVPVTCADMHVFDIWGLKEVPALVLGMDLLRQFEQVALDFGRSQVRFDFI
ncbi:retroviral-like aspartic protease family protein [Phenylobacterium sp.]|uniref:retroviral-like aspartic protease family protein n=1 Tax=Phenylobacterium sp. TaxID=1871053 RepID=UPI0025CC8D7C|nr:retroviral-like aspartic protease family protein [Phenylobacterium sp.]